MNKVSRTVGAALIVFCFGSANSSAADSSKANSDGVEAMLDFFEKEADVSNPQPINTAKIIKELHQFTKNVKVYIEKMNIAKQQYYGVMEPSQKLVARCQAMSHRNVAGRNRNARLLLEDTCGQFKRKLKKELYGVAEVLKNSQKLEKEMMDEVIYVKNVLSAKQVADGVAAPLANLLVSIKDLEQRREVLQKELVNTVKAVGE